MILTAMMVLVMVVMVVSGDGGVSRFTTFGPGSRISSSATWNGVGQRQRLLDLRHRMNQIGRGWRGYSRVAVRVRVGRVVIHVVVMVMMFGREVRSGGRRTTAEKKWVGGRRVRGGERVDFVDSRALVKTRRAVHHLKGGE